MVANVTRLDSFRFLHVRQRKRFCVSVQVTYQFCMKVEIAQTIVVIGTETLQIVCKYMNSRASQILTVNGAYIEHGKI